MYEGKTLEEVAENRVVPVSLFGYISLHYSAES